MKKIFVLLPLILALTILPASAAEFQLTHPQRIVDYASIVGEYDEDVLEEKLDEVSEKYDCDIVIVTVDSMDGKSATAYADDYFDYNGYGIGSERSGILFLISMGEREWAFSTSGEAISAFTDYGLMQMEDAIIPYLSSGEYYEAFTEYIEICGDFLDQYENGEPYDIYYDKNEYRDEYRNEYYDALYGNYNEYAGNRGSGTGTCLLGSVVVGFVIAIIVVSTMKSELNTVKMQSSAANYVKQNSFRLTTQRDIFLYRKVSKVRRDTDSNNRSGHSGHRGGSTVHRSSSGRSHGGRSGRF